MPHTEIRRLLIVSHVPHFRHDGRLHAYGPYGREVDLWADLFPEVLIAAPCRDESPPGDALPLRRSNIRIAPQWETGGHTLWAKLHQCMMLPMLCWGLLRAMRQADAVHVRAPGNLGLLGALLAPLVCRYRVAKYAGQWNGYAGERFVVRLQRAVLKSRYWNAPVTVYGQWPGQPAHVHAFFTSMMSAEQVRRAEESAREKRLDLPQRVLFAGRLSEEKRVDALLDAAAIARGQGLDLKLTIVGGGPDREQLERRTDALGLRSVVRFTGALPYEESLRWYEWAHCLVLPSRHSEGWPKVVAEAMCYGLLCIAVRHGQVPAMLEGRGILLETGSVDEIAAALCDVGHRPEHYSPLMPAASQWARAYSLEGLRAALAELLRREWNVPIRPRGDPGSSLDTEPALASGGSR